MADAVRDLLRPLKAQLGKVILGKPAALDQLMIGLLSASNVLLEDVPGVGKTTLAKALARSFAGDFKRVQFTPDHRPCGGPLPSRLSLHAGCGEIPNRRSGRGVRVREEAFMVFRFRRRLRWRRGKNRNAPAAVIPDSWSWETRTLLLGVDAVCAAGGKPRPPHRAPREHVVDPRISLTEEERSACLRAVDLLYAQAYGDRAATPRDLAEVTAGLIALGARRSASP